MQKGKAGASPPAMVFQGRPPQQNPRGPPSSQQRPDDFNARQQQTFQLQTQMPQNIVMGHIPGQMQTPQGQPRMPNQQQFYHGQRLMRNNPPMYASPPGPPMTVQMIGPGPPPFIPPGHNPQFIPQHVEYTQVPMGGPSQMQYRPQQAMQGQFPPVSGPSQLQRPYGYPQTQVYPMGQSSPPVYIVRAPSTPMTGMPQYQAQNFEPRARERKIIQIMDPNSNKDVTQKIINRQPSGSLTGSTTGTPNNSTPDISRHSSNSSTPPLTVQQQAEANVRAQFAAQVAATLANDSKEEPKKVAEYTVGNLMGETSVVNSVDAITSAKGIIPNVTAELFVYDLFYDERFHKEAQESSAAAYVVKTVVKPAKETAQPAANDMKKKKEKQCLSLKDMENRSSEKEMDLMEAYTEKTSKEENQPMQRLSDGTSKRKSPQERVDLEFGQRVVTCVNDYLTRGTVRYIGQEQGLDGNLFTIVGLEMDKRVGRGTGKYKGRQLFCCETGFAVFVDIENLILEEDIDGNHKETTCTGTKPLDKQDAAQEHIRKESS